MTLKKVNILALAAFKMYDIQKENRTVLKWLFLL